MFDLKLFLINSGYDKYKEAVRLSEIQSKLDPETEPYVSFYKAREIWKEIENELEKCFEQNQENSDIQILCAAIDLKLGRNYVETEERTTGEEMLKKCLERLKLLKMEKKACGIVQEAMNQLGILYSDRGNYDKSIKILSISMKLYKEYSQEVGNSPYTCDDIFCELSDIETEEVVKRRNEKFEDAYTHTLYYLAQVYSKVGASDQSAIYCKETLTRQLASGKYQPLDWAINAATLAQYFSINNRFAESRRCIAAAESVLSEGGTKPENLTVNVSHCDGQTEVDNLERLSKAWADLYRLWVKYFLALVEFSRDRLINAPDISLPYNFEPNRSLLNTNNKNSKEENKDSNEACNDPDEAQSPEHESKMMNAFFGDLELTSIEARVRVEPIRTFDEARDVFKVAQLMIKLALEFYVIDGHCSDHISIIQDHSCLYKHIAFFEPDLQRQCQMHKRRADLLSALLKQLNQQHYLLICRQLMFELGEIYSTMVDNKLTMADASHAAPNDPCWIKINQLVRQTIDQFQAYISTLKKPDGQLPNKFSEDDMRPALIAHFYCGRYYSKFMEFEPRKLYENVCKSMDNYSYLVDYCKRNPEAVDAVKLERDSCEEMVKLLPARLQQIQRQIDA